MKHIRFGLMAVFLSLSCSVAEAPQPIPGDSEPKGRQLTLSSGARSEPGLKAFSLRHGGRTRRYLVYVPTTFVRSQRVAAVLTFHGGGGDAQGVDAYSGMNAAAERARFLAVYPEGSDKTWNAGACCGKAATDGVDDVGFVSKMLDRLARDFPLDTSKVYAAGISNGGMFTYRLACELSERLTAIATVAAVGVMPKCSMTRPVPTLAFHGRLDRCVPFGGGMLGHCFQDYLEELYGISIAAQAPIPLPGAETFYATWRGQLGIAATPHEWLRSGSSRCVVSASATDPKLTASLCISDDGGHTWPGGAPIPACQEDPTSDECVLYEKHVGTIARDIVATDMMWEFFKTH